MRVVLLVVAFGCPVAAAAFYANDPGFALGVALGVVFGAAVIETPRKR